MEHVDNIRDRLREERRRGDPALSDSGRTALLKLVSTDDWGEFVDSVLAEEDVDHTEIG